MCISVDELKKLSDKDLIHSFQRAIVLDTKNSGNGHNPFDQDQLLEELNVRLKRPAVPKITVKLIEVNKTEPRTKLLQITVESEKASWEEVAHTEREAWFFLRGIKAIISFGRDFAGIEEPPIPNINSLDL